MKMLTMLCLFPAFMPVFGFSSNLPLKEYLQEKIDETATEMSHMLCQENYEIENRWIFLDGRLNAYYDIYYRFAVND